MPPSDDTPRVVVKFDRISCFSQLFRSLRSFHPIPLLSLKPWQSSSQGCKKLLEGEGQMLRIRLCNLRKGGNATSVLYTLPYLEMQFGLGGHILDLIQENEK